jgi:hypothetical protein
LELFLQGARTDPLEPIISPITRRALVYRAERRSATPCAREARAANRIEPDAAGAEDHDCLAGADVGGIQDGTSARHNAAAEQRCLGERKLLGHRGELVLVDERLFGEASQSKALVQAGPVSGQARCISRSAYRRRRMFALEGPARQTSSACPHDCAREPTT